jgi:hypothetical protein
VGPRPRLSHESQRRRRTSEADCPSDQVHYKFFGAPSISFGIGPISSKSGQNIYYEVEFCGVTGVNNDVFDLKALQDIHIGIHGTKGHSGAVWTFSWSKAALDKRLAHFFFLHCCLVLTLCVLCPRRHASLALQKVSADLRPILGVAVQTHGTTSGNVYVCWALAQKKLDSNQSQYSIHDLTDHVTSEVHHEVVLHTAESLRYVGSHGKWYLAFSEGRGPKTDPHNGNIFFPYIEVNSSDKTFKVYTHIFLFVSLQEVTLLTTTHIFFSCATTSE